MTASICYIEGSIGKSKIFRFLAIKCFLDDISASGRKFDAVCALEVT
jgi:hypothetical protein